jgi:hypothetical protein
MKSLVKTFHTTCIYNQIASYLSPTLRLTAWKNAEGTTILLLFWQPVTIQYAPHYAVEGY